MPKRVPTFRPGPPKATAKRLYEAQGSRQADKNFYSSEAWRRVRRLVLAERPLCVDCGKEDPPRHTPATEVHHIEERKDRPDLALDRDNLEGLCKPHHNMKRRRAWTLKILAIDDTVEIDVEVNEDAAIVETTTLNDRVRRCDKISKPRGEGQS